MCPVLGEGRALLLTGLCVLAHCLWAVASVQEEGAGEGEPGLLWALGSWGRGHGGDGRDSSLRTPVASMGSPGSARNCERVGKCLFQVWDGSEPCARHAFGSCAGHRRGGAQAQSQRPRAAAGWGSRHCGCSRRRWAGCGDARRCIPTALPTSEAGQPARCQRRSLSPLGRGGRERARRRDVLLVWQRAGTAAVAMAPSSLRLSCKSFQGAVSSRSEVILFPWRCQSPWPCCVRFCAWGTAACPSLSGREAVAARPRIDGYIAVLPGGSGRTDSGAAFMP